MVKVVPNFLLDPVAERNAALAATFETHERNGITYRGIAETKDDPSLFKIACLNYRELDPKSVVIWRRYLESEDNETFIHVDSDIADLTGVLFLTDPKDCSGGLAFWKHKETGFVGHPSEEDLEQAGLHNIEDTWKKFYAEGFEEDKWEMIHYVPMEFNTLVTFPSALYHSRYPKKPFGTSVENARLIKTFFVKWKQ